jgi:hypothetical protein
MAIENESLPMQFRLKALLASYIGFLNLSLIYVLVTIWPGSNATADAASLAPEARYLICSAVAGALGAYIHLATSFINHAGSGHLSSSWGWWYVLRPWIGSALAVVMYFVIRAGLISGTGDTATMNMNPYGICALSALTGMFSKQATEKLREVFENICATK